MSYQRLPVPAEEPPTYEVAASRSSEGDVLFEHNGAAEHSESDRFLPEHTASNNALPSSGGAESDEEDEVDHLDVHSDDEALRREMETFEILEPEDESNSIYTRVTASSKRFARGINERIIHPVQQKIIDPVFHIWQSLAYKFDQILSRFGNPLMLKRLLYLFVVAAAIFAAISYGIFPSGMSDGEFSQQFHTQEHVRNYIRDLMDIENMKQRSQYLSSMAHMTGTSGDRVLKDYVRDSFVSYGIRPIRDQTFQSFLSFPNTTEDAMVLKFVNEDFSANLWEKQAYPNADSNVRAQPRPFLGLAASGEAQGHAVYVNYGTKDDLRKLKDMGISLKDSIVFMKYGKMETGLKILLAEGEGAKAAVLFTGNAKGDGSDIELPINGVQRDHVGISAINPGDILTPGWSQGISLRVLEYSMVKSIPKIPAIPISWSNAKPFLDSLKGHGKKMSDDWAGSNLDEWWTGNNDSPQVYLKNDPVEVDRHELWNVIGKIVGMEDARQAVIIGAHRDSFCFGNSGSASGTVILMEVARVLSLLNRNFGWEPLRSLYFASWDGGDENYIGSTEWVENNADQLRQEGIIYINLDEAINGHDLDIRGHPAVSDILEDILSSISHPEDRNKTLSDMWGHRKPGELPSGGDWMAFQSLVGMASLDVRFKDSSSSSTPRHSCFDTFEWQTKHVDPDFKYHQALTEVVAYLALSYSDSPLLNFDIGLYGEYILRYTRDLVRYAESQEGFPHSNINFGALIGVGDLMKQAGVAYRDWLTNWHMMVVDGESPIVTIHRRNWNARVMLLDKNLLDINGIPNRNWFKHAIYGPQLWHPTEGEYLWSTFPGIRDALEAKNWDQAQQEIDRVAGIISKAAYTFIEN